jgi:hypothetical protein
VGSSSTIAIGSTAGLCYCLAGTGPVPDWGVDNKVEIYSQNSWHTFQRNPYVVLYQRTPTRRPEREQIPESSLPPFFVRWTAREDLRSSAHAKGR